MYSISRLSTRLLSIRSRFFAIRNFIILLLDFVFVRHSAVAQFLFELVDFSRIGGVLLGLEVVLDLLIELVEDCLDLFLLYWPVVVLPLRGGLVELLVDHRGRSHLYLEKANGKSCN